MHAHESSRSIQRRVYTHTYTYASTERIVHHMPLPFFMCRTSSVMFFSSANAPEKSMAAAFAAPTAATRERKKRDRYVNGGEGIDNASDT